MRCSRAWCSRPPTASCASTKRASSRRRIPRPSKLFDCAAYELLDEPIAKFITLLAGEGAGARLGALHGVIRECDARTLDGEVFPVEISVSRVRLNTERLYTAIVRDIRERRAQQSRLQHQATHDSLTVACRIAPRC